MTTHSTKAGIYEDTPFGTVAIGTAAPTIGRLFGYETGNQRLFLGRSRVPPARVDLYAQFERVVGKMPLMGFISVFHLLVLADQSDELSRLHKYAVERYVGYTPTPHRPRFHLLDIEQEPGKPGPKVDPGTGPLHTSESMADLFAVALLNAAG